MTNILKCTALITLIVIMGWSCSKNESTASTSGDKASSSKPPTQSSASPSSTSLMSKSISVDVQEVKTYSLERKVEFVGSLLADEEVTVSSEMDNRIEKVAVDLGDRVRKGDLLVKLADEELKLKLDEAGFHLKEIMASLGIDEKNPVVSDPAQTTIGKKAKADRDDAELNYKRVKSLIDQRIASRHELDNAETRFKIATANYEAALEGVKTLMATLEARKAALALARKKLADTVIRAPIDGAVSKRFVSTGEYVKVGNPLLILVKDNPLKLSGAVPERYSGEIRVGQEVSILVDPYPDQLFRGKVARISPSSSIDTRSLTLEAGIPNEKLLLKPGFFARVTVKTRIDLEVPMIPGAALYTFAGVNKVFVIFDGKAQQRFVKLGTRNGDLIEVVEGVKTGELVAVSSLSRLEDQAPVTVRER